MMLFPAFFLQIAAQRRACVLDPALALSRNGLALARGLAQFVDVWLVNEFWRILDNTFVYVDRPETMLPPRALQPSATGDPAELRAALLAWERFRYVNDAQGLKFNWAGERADESQLAAGTPASVLEHWPFLAAALERRLAAESDVASPLVAGWRDALALTAALRTAFVLTGDGPLDGRDGEAPALCRLLTIAGIRVTDIAGSGDPRLAIERTFIDTVLVHAGVAKYLWAGLPLAVVFLIVPSADNAADCAPAAADFGNEDVLAVAPDPAGDVLASMPAASIGDPWKQAEALWFRL